MANLIFITGTDTGVGKTVLTAMLLRHLRQEGRHALAVKPFCTGSRDDALLLHEFEKNFLTLDEVNPFFFKQPLAPAAARLKKEIPLDAVLEKIRVLAARCEVLLVEGVGGVLAPLGKNYTVATLIAGLDPAVIVVSRNALGTLNHTLLTAHELQAIGVDKFAIVMVDAQNPDISARSNPTLLKKMLPHSRIFSLPYLGSEVSNVTSVKKNALFLKKTLAQISRGASLVSFFRSKGKKRLLNKTR
jgi:dethiobiotin synthetase